MPTSPAGPHLARPLDLPLLEPGARHGGDHVRAQHQGQPLVGGHQAQRGGRQVLADDGGGRRPGGAGSSRLSSEDRRRNADSIHDYEGVQVWPFLLDAEGPFTEVTPN